MSERGRSAGRPGDASRTVIRAPNHLGDLVMALPACRALPAATILVRRSLGPLVELAGLKTMTLDSGAAGFARATLQLRQRRFDLGILLTPSFSSAALFAAGGIRQRRGTNTDGRTFLLSAVVDRKRIAQQHRTSAYVLLTTGATSDPRPLPTLDVPRELRARFRSLISTDAPLIGIVPGSNAPSRRWNAERFVKLVQTLSEDARVIVFGSVSEREVTRRVAHAIAIDLGGATDLPMLAAGLAECSLVIGNDSGPVHLAAAVGTPTISLWGAGKPAESGPPAPHVLLRHDGLPCLECVKNRCPRDGKGFILPEAYNECLQLIQPERVLAAARAELTS